MNRAAPPTPAARRTRRALRAAAVLGLLLAIGVVGSVCVGSTGAWPLGRSLQGVLATLGLAEPLSPGQQTIVGLRLSRSLAALGVGAALALSGGLLQGVFRNELASPSVIGISSGAGLGASLAILALGGFLPLQALGDFGMGASLLVTGSAFAGALLVGVLVATLSMRGGRVSVPTLLLVGIALNAMIGGLVTAIQAYVLDDADTIRALMSWSFGSISDRSSSQVGLVFVALALALVALPFVARELDLFAGGEDDARALGVDTTRVKIVALAAAALLAAAAVSVAGQIAFLGLVVPHLLRLTVDRSNTVLLPMCLLGGPLFLLGTDLIQRLVLGDRYLPPGVLMSLLGGPFFLFLLLRNRSGIRGW